jgi:hypothetical protein
MQVYSPFKFCKGGGGGIDVLQTFLVCFVLDGVFLGGDLTSFDLLLNSLSFYNTL